VKTEGERREEGGPEGMEEERLEESGEVMVGEREEEIGEERGIDNESPRIKTTIRAIKTAIDPLTTRNNTEN
jgi:hypothetical protein